MLSDLKKREESTCVPPAVQELELAAESCKETEEQSTEAEQMESSPSGSASAPAASGTSGTPQQDGSSSTSSSPAVHEDQAGAASTKSTEE